MPIRSVLLLEADEAARSHGRAVLEQSTDWKVSAPSAPGTALLQLSTLRPDVLLVDASLLNGGGAEALTQVRSDRALARLVVLATSTAPLSGVPGTAGVIRKPLQTDTMTEIQRLAAAARIEQQLARLNEIGGPAFVQEMIDLFLELAPQRLTAVRDGIEAGDLGAVARAVHPLKSSAGNLGADRVQDLAERTEQLAMAGSAAAMPMLLRQLEASLAEVYERLRSVRGTAS
jgi:HPt (histidine-containing phosphotransfer) domain-containing protein